MRWTSFFAVAIAAATVVAAWPADAASRRRTVTRVDRSEPYPGARVVNPRYARRAPTRITVRRARTFLDPGTEVLPRSQPELSYAFPPFYYPSRSWDPMGTRRFPLPGAYDIPSFY